MRPLDFLPRRVALAAGGALGAGAGAAVVWSGAPWAYAAGAGVLGLAGWVASSAEAVARVVEAEALPVAAPYVGSIHRTPPPDPPTGKLSDALEMIPLPGGAFVMGSPESEPGRYSDEVQHEEIVTPFSISRYAVRQSLYEVVMGPGARHQTYRGPDLPVHNVSWFDAVRFCNALSRAERLPEAYVIGEGEAPDVQWNRESDGYRLPTEAEWEYAARAGTKTTYSFGDDDRALDDYAWWDENRGPQPVGTRNANPWGLFDFHGNVREWCWDVYGPYDQQRPPVGVRVLRGGSLWLTLPGDLRSAFRNWGPPGLRDDDTGFRCARGGSRQPG